MANYTPTVYDDLADLLDALEAIENTTSIEVVPFQEGAKTKFILIQ